MKLKRKIKGISVLLLATIILALIVEATATEISRPTEELVIGLTQDNYNSIKELIALKNGEIVKNISANNKIVAIVAKLPFNSIPAFVEKAKATGLTRYVEPNFRLQMESLPNDPYWSYQWGPQKIEADWAWNATFGNSAILVAVIDSGIDYTHPDLAANYVPLGYDWVNNDDDPMDDYGHGTKVAGIVAAVTNNEIGIAGLAQVKVIAEKVFNDSEGGAVSWLVSAIFHATDKGAQIINLSLSTEYNVSSLYEAIQYAYDHNVLLVAAAGNQASNTKRYPAAYNEVIAVTSTNITDQKAPSSNYGDWVELAAPGVDIFTTDLLNEKLPPDYQYYRWGSGTSFACPHVSGVAALTWSQFPNATADWIRTRLRNTTDDLGEPGFDEYYGYGRINARKAIGTPAINYTLAITTTLGGTTNPAPGNYTYPQGRNVLVQAIPNTGYGLNHWELNGTNVSSTNPYTVFMDGNYTLKAVFVPAYTLTINTTAGGTTNPSPGSYVYNLNTSVTVTATPDTYYIFDHWELDESNVGSTNPYPVLMDNNHTLRAVFIQINYTLTITATANGTTDPEPGIYTYSAGSNILVTAIPSTNHVLDYWKLNGIDIGTTESVTISMDGNNTLHASFRVGFHNVAIANVIPFKTIVGQGYSMNVNVTVTNQGDYTETFNVTVFVNTTSIASQNITLTSGSSATITFSWNTTGFTKGNYTLSAYARPVSGETDIADNTLNSWVFLTVVGDVNGDKKVNILDAIILANNFGQSPPLNQNTDINNDGRVNVLDCIILSNYFGQSWT